MASTPLLTYSEVLERILRITNSANDERVKSLARAAILDAYAEFPNLRNWKYYYARGRVSTDASYSTGTVEYDHCVTPEHEALTRDGWKTYDKLKVGDEILTYNHDSETCSWQGIQHLHVYKDYDGEILDVRRKGRSVLRCTPNHRIPVYERYATWDNQRRRVRKTRKRWVTARELTCEMSVPLAAPLEKESCGPLTPRLAGLLSWCVTDGHGTFKHWGTARISQSKMANPEKCQEIEALIGGEPTIYARDGVNSYRVPKEDARIWKRLVSSKDDLPSLFTQFGVHQAESAIKAMILAEAGTNPNGQKVFTQWGENKPVAEAFQIACLLAGKATNISTGQFRCNSFGKSKIETRYQCPVRRSNHIKLAKGSEWIPYRGIVWCPQVPDGAWVVRCNGAVMITGNSDGANERQLTLTSGTWPTNAARGIVLIDSVEYHIESRVSDSIVTLSVNSNPGADIASGTSFQWWRDTYPLPIDFTAADRLIDHDRGYIPDHYPAGTTLNSRSNRQQSNEPMLYSFISDPDYVGAMAVMFEPPPDDEYQFDFVYKRHPLPMRTPDYHTGTVAVSSTTVTGTGTSWTDRMVGTVIRFPESGVNQVPTGLDGAYPFAEERIVTAVASTTSLTIDAALSGTYSGVKYRISDYIDLDYAVMSTAFHKLCEYRFSENLNRDDQGSRFRSYNMCLQTAKEQDGKRSISYDAPMPVRYYNRMRFGLSSGDSE